MKKAFLLVAALGLLYGCHNSNNSQNETVTPEVIETIDESSFDTEDIDALKVVDEEDFYGAVDIMVAAPVTKNKALSDSICFWINACLGEEYDGDPCDLQTMIDYYKDQIFDEYTEIADGFHIEIIFFLIENDSQSVSYGFSTFYELDGAPESTYDCVCVTFDQTTGKRSPKEC